MINPQWLQLPMFRTIFYGPKDVRAIEVRLYVIWKIVLEAKFDIKYNKAVYRNITVYKQLSQRIRFWNYPF